MTDPIIFLGDLDASAEIRGAEHCTLSINRLSFYDLDTKAADEAAAKLNDQLVTIIAGGLRFTFPVLYADDLTEDGVAVSLTGESAETIFSVTDEHGQPIAPDDREIIGWEECDMGCCSTPIYQEVRP